MFFFLTQRDLYLHCYLKLLIAHPPAIKFDKIHKINSFEKYTHTLDISSRLLTQNSVLILYDLYSRCSRKL